MKKTMKMEKVKQKWTMGLLALMLAASLTGCGSSYDKSAEVSDNSSASYDMEVTEDDVAEDTGESAEGGVTDEAAAQQKATNEKIIYTYNYSVETKKFDELLDNVQKRITEYGGYLESSESNGTRESGANRYANLVIRIPADRMGEFLSMVKDNSNVTYSSSSSENVTLSYVDMQSHVEALRVEQETLMDLLDRATKLEDILTIQSQLTSVRYEIESYESQLRVYDNRVNYSTLYLDISEVERETTVIEEKSYFEEIRSGLSDTFYDLGQGLRTFSIGLIVNLPYIVLWALVIALVVLIVRKVLKAEKKRQSEHPALVKTEKSGRIIASAPEKEKKDEK